MLSSQEWFLSGEDQEVCSRRRWTAVQGSRASDRALLSDPGFPPSRQSIATLSRTWGGARSLEHSRRSGQFRRNHPPSHHQTPYWPSSRI